MVAHSECLRTRRERIALGILGFAVVVAAAALVGAVFLYAWSDDLHSKREYLSIIVSGGPLEILAAMILRGLLGQHGQPDHRVVRAALLLFGFAGCLAVAFATVMLFANAIG